MMNPEKADIWLNGGEIGHRLVANTLNLPTEIREIYGLLCDYTDPNFKSAKENLIPTKIREYWFFDDSNI